MADDEDVRKGELSQAYISWYAVWRFENRDRTDLICLQVLFFGPRDRPQPRTTTQLGARVLLLVNLREVSSRTVEIDCLIVYIIPIEYVFYRLRPVAVRGVHIESRLQLDTQINVNGFNLCVT